MSRRYSGRTSKSISHSKRTAEQKYTLFSADEVVLKMTNIQTNIGHDRLLFENAFYLLLWYGITLQYAYQYHMVSHFYSTHQVRGLNNFRSTCTFMPAWTWRCSRSKISSAKSGERTCSSSGSTLVVVKTMMSSWFSQLCSILYRVAYVTFCTIWFFSKNDRRANFGSSFFFSRTCLPLWLSPSHIKSIYTQVFHSRRSQLPRNFNPSEQASR